MMDCCTVHAVHYLSEPIQILSFRGRRSRNKVSVGEPAEGSLTINYSIQKKKMRERENFFPFFFFFLNPTRFKTTPCLL